MATTYASCPQSFVYPLFYGLRGSTSDFTFTKALPHVLSIDFNEHFMVSGGYWELSGTTTGFWPSTDVELDNCDGGSSCSAQSDISGSQWQHGLFYIANHDKYDDKKSYIFSNAGINMRVQSVALANVERDHEVMNLAKDTWSP